MTGATNPASQGKLDQDGLDRDSPNRVVPLEGGINFRDLGGYPGSGQRPVRWRKLFRCGHLRDLTARDLALLEQWQVAEVHDFRRLDEQQRAPNQPLRARYRNDYQISVGSLSGFWEYLAAGRLSADSAHQLVVGAYRDCIDDVAPHYRRLLQALLTNAPQATVFHCAAGKDRTGMAAALILSALGVSREIIVEDYLLTQQHFDTEALIGVVEQHLRDAGVDYWEREWLLPYCSVHRDNIDGFLDSIDARYGSVNAYLEQALGLGSAERRLLQQHYLE